MKVFLSHSSRDKALVREVRSYLPRHIQTWLDEDDLLVGQDLQISIKEAITDNAEYVVIFLGREAIRSTWVKQELEWALEREHQLGRIFVLPVLLDDCWSEVDPPAFQKRKYLKCLDQSERGVRSLAEALSSAIFAYLSRNLDQQGFMWTPNRPRARSTLALSRGTTMEFVLVQPAVTAKDASPDGNPMDNAFWMARSPVDVAQWEAVLGKDPSVRDRGALEHVQYSDAERFICVLNSRADSVFFRLPTRAEWKHACRHCPNVSFLGKGGTGLAIFEVFHEWCAFTTDEGLLIACNPLSETHVSAGVSPLHVGFRIVCVE